MRRSKRLTERLAILEVRAVNGAIELGTRRLFLRQWRASDREPFASLNADAAVMAHLPAPLTREKSDAMADHCERLIAKRGWGGMGHRDQGNGRVHWLCRA